MRIRITSPGIFGLPMTGESPNGEYPVGHVIDLGDNDPPSGWAGRYEVVSAGAPSDAEPVTNPAQGDDKPVRRARPQA